MRQERITRFVPLSTSSGERSKRIGPTVPSPLIERLYALTRKHCHATSFASLNL
jgi:hypothetical protein